jgi:molecular chaperone GrpE
LAKFGKRKPDTGTGGWDARRTAGPDPGSAAEAQAGTSPEAQQEIMARLDLIEQQAAEYHRRSAHRESVIDHLHAENQELRDNARRSVFEPVAADLARLYDSLGQEADRLTGTGPDPAMAKLMLSFAEDVELVLDRCGFEPVTAVAGDPFIVGEHAVVAVDDTEDESLNNTVARVVATGLRDKATGQVRRPLKVRVYRIADSADSPDSSDQGEPHDDDLRD